MGVPPQAKTKQADVLSCGGYNSFIYLIFAVMPDSLYGARLQGFTVVVFIVAKSRAWFDEYIYHDSLQARAIEGIGH